MSETVDQKVVEMQFDNRQFEQNVRTSMSTLEKLKQSLHLTGAAKGLDSINNAARNVDMSGLSGAVQSVKAEFSAMQVVGMAALANITNSAINTGKRMINALTLEPVKTGFQEYETQINSVQTILANTKSKGSTIKDVNEALYELNRYADLTIYNFTEMTRNIGTFTAAGIDLDTSVSAIQGIANLAAVSGSTSQQASVAMYQLSQALATGTVKLMDWNSVVNAGMGGEVFQNALKKTSELLGTGAEKAIKAEGSFRESLSKGWLTSQVLTETLKKFTTSGANEYIAEYTGLSEKAIEAALEHAKAKHGEAKAVEFAAKALAKKSGKNEQEIKDVLDMAETATNAATKVKTFTQLWDVMKESAQSGWSRTWQLIVGDFEDAKNLLTPLSDFITNLIGTVSDARNNLLEAALNSPFVTLAKKIEKVTSATKEVSKAMKNYGDIVNRVIGGEYGNGQLRWDKLTKEGYDWAKVQNAVNEKLGSSVRHAEQATKANKELNESQAMSVDQLLKLSDAELKEVGFKKTEIESLRELQKEAKRAGTSVEELIKKYSGKKDGRTLLIESFKNAGLGLLEVFKALGKAWEKVFPPMTAYQLYDMISSVNALSQKMLVTDETSKKLYKTFRGLFSILKIVKTLTMGPLTVGFKLLKGVLGAFDLDILDVTAHLGDTVYKFSNWLDETLDVTKAIKVLKPYIMDFVDGLVAMYNAAKNSEFISTVFDGIASGAEKLSDINLLEIGKNIIDGLHDGILEYGDNAVDAIVSVGKNIISKIKEVFGIHSPSKVMFSIGVFLMSGLILGIVSKKAGVLDTIVDFMSDVISAIKDRLGEFNKSTSSASNTQNGWVATLVGSTTSTLASGEKEVGGAVSSFGTSIIDAFKNIPWDNVFAIGVSAVLLKILKDLTSVVKKFAAPMEGLGKLFESASSALKNGSAGIKKALVSIAKLNKAKAFKVKMEGIRTLGLSLLMIAGAVALLTVVDQDKLDTAVLVIAKLAGVIAGLSFWTTKMSDSSTVISKNGLKFKSMTGTLIGIGIAVALMATAVKVIGGMRTDEMTRGFAALNVITDCMGRFILGFALLTLVSNSKNVNFDRFGKMMTKLSISMLLMVGVVKLAGMLNEDELNKGKSFMIAFVAFTAVLGVVACVGGDGAKQIGSMALKISFAMVLLIGVCKLAGTLSAEEMFKGAAFAAAFLTFVSVLVSVTKIAGTQTIAKVSGLLIACSIAMGLMAVTVKILGTINLSDIIKGTLCMAAFEALVIALIYAVKPLGSAAPKLAGTILAASVAIGIMAGVAIMLGLIDTKALAKGVIAVGMLGVVLSLMIASTRMAEGCVKNLVAMSVAIGVMAISVAALSMIDGKKLAGATIAMTSMMGIFTLMIAVTGKASKSMAGILVMTGMVALLALLISQMAKLPADNALKISLSISALLLAMAGSMALASALGPMVVAGMAGLLAMTGVVAILGAILGDLSRLPVDSTMSNALAMSALLIAMSASLALASLVGPLAITGSIGLLAMSGVVAILSNIMADVSKLPLESTRGNVEVLISLINELGEVVNKTALVGSVAAIPAAIGLATFASVMTGVITTIGAFSNIPGFTKLVQDGGATLKLVGTAIGGFVGSIVSGFAVSATDGLADVGTNLSKFAITAMPFFLMTRSIDSTTGEKVKMVVSSILSLTGASFLNTITKFATFGHSFADLGTQLSDFMISAMPFIENAKQIDSGVINGAKAISEVVLTLCTADLVSTISSWLIGEHSYEEFGKQLKAFAVAMSEFSMSVSDGSIDSKAVSAAAKCGEVMAELQDKLPNTGGVIQWFAGQKSLSEFGKQLIDYGVYMVRFSNVLSNANISEDAVTLAKNAGSIMLELQNSLPNTNGVVQWFTGSQDMSKFGEGILSFGESISAFAKKVKGLNTSDVSSAYTAGSLMATLQKAIPTKELFDGKVSLSDFGKEMVGFASKLVSFSTTISGKIDVDTITASGNAVVKIADVIAKLNTVKTDGIAQFKTVLTDLATLNYDSVATSLKNGESLFANVGTSFTTNLANGINLGKTTVTIAVSSIVTTMLSTLTSTSSDTLVTTGATMINDVASGMTSKTSLITNTLMDLMQRISDSLSSNFNKFKTIGSTLITRFTDGVNSKKATGSSAVEAIVINTVTLIRGKYSSFYAAGSYVVDGFTNGISDRAYKAKLASEAMANSALRAAKEALDEHSPSKEMYKVGAFAGQGFVNALGTYTSTAYDSAYSVGTEAKNGLTRAIAKVSKFLDPNLDIQPTIRPIVDLSSVSSGAAAIDSMLGKNVGFNLDGALSNMSSIRSIMNRRSQNGDFNDVVNAIDKLNKNLGNVGNTYNSIAGVTYSNDSEISAALETIVKAARMERRM